MPGFEDAQPTRPDAEAPDRLDHVHPAPPPERHHAPSPQEMERLAEEIAHESPEGLPGDPRAGPTLLRGEVAAILAGLALVAVLLGVLVQPVVGLAFAGIALIALVLNPTVPAALLRAREREALRQKHRRHGGPPA